MCENLMSIKKRMAKVVVSRIEAVNYLNKEIPETLIDKSSMDRLKTGNVSFISLMGYMRIINGLDLIKFGKKFKFKIDVDDRYDIVIEYSGEKIEI